MTTPSTQIAESMLDAMAGNGGELPVPPYGRGAEGCKCPSAESHTCPYAVEINEDEDEDSLCNCCEACAHECAMDI